MQVLQNVFGIRRDETCHLYYGTLIQLEIYPSFCSKSFSLIILRYPFSKVLFSPTLLHRISLRKNTGGLAKHDFVLYF